MAGACVNRSLGEGKQLLPAHPCNLIWDSLRQTSPPAQKKQHLQEPEAEENPSDLWAAVSVYRTTYVAVWYKASLLQQLKEYAQMKDCQWKSIFVACVQ